jgi:hypothetical protein
MADHPVPASPVELTEEEMAERAQTMYALDQQIRSPGGPLWATSRCGITALIRESRFRGRRISA